MLWQSLKEHNAEAAIANHTAQTLNALGQTHEELGERRKALDYFSQALPLFRATGNHRGEATTLNYTFVEFPHVQTTLQIGGTYVGGSFNSNRRVTIPACIPLN